MVLDFIEILKRISAYPLREEHSPNVELDNFIDGISGT